jgi:hypothetical protein
MFPIPDHAAVERPPVRRRMPRIHPFKRDAGANRDPDFAVRSCLTLSSAFRETYTGNAPGLNFETLYRFPF